jgi:hypothetical protein
MNFEHLRTIRQLAEANPAFSEPSLRWLIFQATNNGLADSGAIVRIGRRVLIDQDRFGRWLETYRESR